MRLTAIRRLRRSQIYKRDTVCDAEAIAETGPTQTPPDSDLRIAFLSQWYPPEPADVPYRIAMSLAESGIRVSVITGVPNYPNGEAHTGYTPWRSTRQVIDGLQVYRTPEYPNHSSSKVGRFANYTSWALSTSFFARRYLRAVDVVLVYSSPALAAIPALVVKYLSGTPYVLLVQDVWPDSIFATGFDGRLLRTFSPSLERLCRFFYAHATQICVTSPGMSDLLRSRGVAREKISLVYNWRDDTREQYDNPYRPPGLPSRTTVRRLLYAGNHGHAQDLEPVIRAAAQVHDIEFVLIGDGAEKPTLIALAKALDATNVRFCDPVPPAELTRLQPAFDAQLVALRNDPLFNMTTPSKLQSILASRMPALAVAGGDVQDVVRTAQCGWVAPPGDIPAILTAMKSFARSSPEDLAKFGRNGLDYYHRFMGRERNLTALLSALTVAAEKHERRTS